LEYVASVYATKVFVDDSISSYSVGYVAAGGGWSGAFIGGATVVVRRQSLNVIDVYVPGLTFTAIATLDLLLKFNPNIPTAHSFNGPQVVYTSKADAYTFLGKAQVVSSVNAPLSIRLKLYRLLLLLQLTHLILSLFLVISALLPSCICISSAISLNYNPSVRRMSMLLMLYTSPPHSYYVHSIRLFTLYRIL